VVGEELERFIEEHFPERATSQERDPGPGVVAQRTISAGPAAVVRASASGYVQHIDFDALVDLATRSNVLVGLERRPGDHVIAGTAVARISPAAKVTAELGTELCATIGLGAVRTPVQDVRFLINQLVEIAQRALSPGINDPSTAQACIDRLGIALGLLARRRTPSSVRFDASGKPRVILKRVDTFESLLDAALSPIRNYSASSVQVSVQLALLLAELAQLVDGGRERQALRAHALLIQRGAKDLSESLDRSAVDEACQCALDAISEGDDQE